MLGAIGIELRVAQELLRRAHPRITMETYQSAVIGRKWMPRIWSSGVYWEQAPLSTREDPMKEDVTVINH